MSIVFSRVLSISTGFVRFNLGSLPVLLAGILFGPWAGFVVGMVADIIGGVLAGYAINPLINIEFKIYYISPLGSFATWKSTKQVGSYDLRTFEIHARPTQKIKDLRPGMSVLLTLN